MPYVNACHLNVFATLPGLAHSNHIIMHITDIRCYGRHFAWSNGGDAWAITQVFKMSAGKVTRGIKPAKACYVVEKHSYLTTTHDI